MSLVRIKLMKLKFWGVRGSIPTPMTSQKLMSKIQSIVQQISVSDLESVYTREKFISNLPKWLTSTVGGNSSCVELKISDDEVFIFDAGTGIRELGKELISKKDLKIHIFLSHFHWDHIQGLPFFDPLYNPNFEIHFYSVVENFQQLLTEQMKAPFFPVEFSSISKNFKFHHIQEGEEFTISNHKINTKQMFHPNGCVAFSVTNSDGKKFIFATDSELKSKDFEITEKNKNFFDNTDVLVLDAQYTVEEAAQKENWGHSTFCYAIDFASTWKVKKLFLYHHEPSYDDKKVFSILESAKWYASYSVQNKIQVELALEGFEEEI